MFDLVPGQYYNTSATKGNLPLNLQGSIISLIVNCTGYSTLKINNLARMSVNKINADGTIVSLANSGTTKISSVDITGCEFIQVSHLTDSVHIIQISLQ